MKNANSALFSHYENPENKREEQKSENAVIEIVGKSLFVFDGNNIDRIFFNRMYRNPWFDRIIMSLICISTLTLAFESPLDNPNG